MRSIQLTGATCNGGGGGILSNDVIKQVSQRYQVIGVCHNAGAHNALLFDAVLIEQGPNLGADMSECEGGQPPGRESDVEFSHAQRFWNVVRIYSGLMWRSHEKLPGEVFRLNRLNLARSPVFDESRLGLGLRMLLGAPVNAALSLNVAAVRPSIGQALADDQEGGAMSGFRPDIHTRYDADEPIEGD
jgi:hypothetical protein